MKTCRKVGPSAAPELLERLKANQFLFEELMDNPKLSRLFWRVFGEYDANAAAIAKAER